MNAERAKIEYNSEYEFILVKTRGKVPSVGDIISLFDEIVIMCELNNCNKILFDATLTKKLPSVSGLYKVVDWMTRKLVLVASLRIAYIISTEIDNDFRFFETASTNRGVRMRSFKTANDAKEWLLKKE